MTNPTVTIITPTTHDRVNFNRQCELFVRQQDYPNIIEHLFDYGDGNVGVKRNRLCKAAKGDIIVHFDSDDWYAKDWVSKCVERLHSAQAPCIGMKAIYYHDLTHNNAYRWSYPFSGMKYFAEATLCYYKSYWETRKHKEEQTGESTPLYPKAEPNDYIDGFIARLHNSNTSSRNQIKSFKSIDINVINSLYNR